MRRYRDRSVAFLQVRAADRSHRHFHVVSLGQTDLSGNWDNGFSIGFIQPVQLGDSICVVAYPEEAL